MAKTKGIAKPKDRRANDANERRVRDITYDSSEPSNDDAQPDADAQVEDDAGEHDDDYTTEAGHPCSSPRQTTSQLPDQSSTAAPAQVHQDEAGLPLSIKQIKALFDAGERLSYAQATALEDAGVYLTSVASHPVYSSSDPYPDPPPGLSEFKAPDRITYNSDRETSFPPTPELQSLNGGSRSPDSVRIPRSDGALIAPRPAESVDAQVVGLADDHGAEDALDPQGNKEDEEHEVAVPDDSTAGSVLDAIKNLTQEQLDLMNYHTQEHFDEMDKIIAREAKEEMRTQHNVDARLNAAAVDDAGLHAGIVGAEEDAVDNDNGANAAKHELDPTEQLELAQIGEAQQAVVQSIDASQPPRRQKRTRDEAFVVVAALVKPSQQWLIQHKMDIQVRRNHAKQMSKPTPRGDMPQIASLRPPKRTRSDQQAGVDGATLPEEERAPKRRCLKEWSHVKANAIKKGATKMAKKAFEIALSSSRQFVRFLTGLGQQANGQEIMLATAQPLRRGILKKPRLPDTPRVPMRRPIVRRHPADIYWDKVHAAAGQKHQEHRMATAATEVDQALESPQGPPRARSPMAQESRIIAIRPGTPNHQDQELVHPPAPEGDALAATDDDPFPFIVHPKYIENHAAHSLQAFEARVAATSLKGVEILFAWHEESCDVDPEFQPTFQGFARAFELVQDPVLLRVHDRLHDKFLGWVWRNLYPLLDQGILTQADVNGVTSTIMELSPDEMEDIADFPNDMDGVVFDNDVDESMTGMSEAGGAETTSSKASSPQPMEGIINNRNTGPLPTGGRKFAKPTGAKR
ncbi:uncharacterized protein MYCGRDRAFT_94916 [Zymoseptoria tritici IPO323]|uniref:Uncharacterized protein n=1 Tax=Zymoseptoria tritici (strain CBS 115943 / IPO323) TaxID=336722 RepID=F9XI32_ZYMTI|nr:uncharacterized protein MYCGRDRAFT_94916 [Zymoseptoria tritici IPO323]EGP85497.1 hypothetical protein MYCGRDRAFT_94916 [Zymoseptoria tritici IPO323]